MRCAMVAVLLGAACVARPELGEVLPDFELVDVNPASDLSGQSVSLRDAEGQVSGWYFGLGT